MPLTNQAIFVFLPEIFLSISGLVMLIALACFNKKITFNNMAIACILVFALAFILALTYATDAEYLGQIISDPLARFGKIIILLCALIVSIFAITYYNLSQQKNQCEYFVLLIFAVVGLLFLCSAQHLLSLYLAIELFSLSAYILTSINRKSLRSTEAGLKYFVLGGLSSCILLFGISFIYGSTGSLQLFTIGNYLANNTFDMTASIGMVFIICSLAFKLSAAPFHMWTPDVYEGAPTSITSFFATAPKIAILIIFSRILYISFLSLIEQWQIIISFIAVISMFTGAISAIWQQNLKRLMAYSSISHVGYALIGLASGTALGIQSMLIYISIYIVITIGIFSAILSLVKNGQLTERISDLEGIKDTNFKYAIMLSIFLFALFGLPPTIGFWGKFSVFMAALKADLIFLALLGAIASVISAYYYLYIMKRMWFDKKQDAVNVQTNISNNLIMMAVFILVCLGLFLPFTLEFVNNQASLAANSLF